MSLLKEFITELPKNLKSNKNLKNYIKEFYKKHNIEQDAVESESASREPLTVEMINAWAAAPSKGGLSMPDLKAKAEEYGVDVKGLKKAEIKDALMKLAAPAAKVVKSDQELSVSLIDKWVAAPSKGGLPMNELKAKARGYGIDVKGLKKADIRTELVKYWERNKTMQQEIDGDWECEQSEEVEKMIRQEKRTKPKKKVNAVPSSSVPEPLYVGDCATITMRDGSTRTCVVDSFNRKSISLTCLDDKKRYGASRNYITKIEWTPEYRCMHAELLNMKNKFKLGDLVMFDGKDGLPNKGYVDKINTKTIGVTSLSHYGLEYNVPPLYLKKINENPRDIVNDASDYMNLLSKMENLRRLT